MIVVSLETGFLCKSTFQHPVKHHSEAAGKSYNDAMDEVMS